MAEQGYVLDIDARFLDNLAKADAALKNSITYSSTLTSQFTNMVGSAGTFKSKVDEVLSSLSKLKGIKVDSLTGMVSIDRDTRKSTDAIELFRANMKALKDEYKSLASASAGRKSPIKMFVSKKDLENIGQVKKGLKEVQEVLRTGKLGDRQISLIQTSSLNAQKEYYKRVIAELSMTDEQRIGKRIALANQELDIVNRNVRAVVNAENKKAKSKAATTKAQAEGVREATQLARTAKTAKELAAAYNAIAVAKKGINPDTKRGQVQLQALARAMDNLDKKRSKNTAEAAAEYQQTVKGSIEYARQAKNIQELKQAKENLNKAKLNVSPGEDGKRELKQINNELVRVEANLRRANKSSSSFKNSLSGIGSMMATAFGGHTLMRFTDRLVKIHGEFEKINISLKVLLGSSARAEILWDRISSLALKSPFTIQQLAQATKQMAAYRIESSKLYSSTKMLADISAGLGVEMSRLILTYGQVKAANFLRGTELRQFSEAGIDMLGQLASYFSEIEGRAISAAEVFNMISNRQVLFEDVDAVLHRVTDRGGAFYEMQEQQSKTLAGQISNLKDAIQIMFHEIGSSQHGLILSIVQGIREIVSNWEKWLPLLAGVAAALTGVKTVLLLVRVAAFALTPALNLLGAALWKLGVQTTRTMNAMIALQSATPIGWIKSIASVLVGAGAAWWAYSQSSEAAAESSEKASSAFADVFSEQSEAIMGIGNDILAYTMHINSLKSEQESLSETDNKYIANANTIDRLISERSARVAELARQNSELAISISGVINEEKELLGLYSGEAKRQAQLASLTNTLNVDAEDFKILKDFEREFTDVYARMGTADLDLGDLYNKKLAEANGDFDKMLEVINEYTNALGEVFTTQEARDKFLPLMGLDEGYSEVKLRLQETVDDAAAQWRRLNDVTGELSKENKDKIVRDFEDIIGSMDLTISQANIMRDALSEAFGFDWYSLPVELMPWQERYNNYLGAGATLFEMTSTELQGLDKTFKMIDKANTTEAQMIEMLDDRIKHYQTVIAMWPTYTQSQIAAGQTLYAQAEYDEAVKELPISEYLRNFFPSKDKKGGRSTDPLKDVINSIKEVHKAFKSLQKDVSDETAKTGAWDKYGDMVKEALKGMNINIDNFLSKVGDLTSEDSIVAAYDELMGLAKDSKQRVSIEKAKGEFIWEIKLEEDKASFDNAQKRVDDLMSGYELGVELDKLHVSKDFAKNFFDIDAVDLPELRLQIMAQYEGLDIGDDERKKINETLRKVDEMETKAQQERLKKYIEFTRDAMGERGKIMLDGFYERQDIGRTFRLTGTMAVNKDIIGQSTLDTMHELGKTMQDLINLSDEELVSQWGFTEEKVRLLREVTSEMDEQRQLVEKASIRATDEKLQQKDWEDFRGSDTFQLLFSDLANASDTALTGLIDKLEEYKDQWDKLPLGQMKQLVKLLNDARNAQASMMLPSDIINAARKDMKDSGFSSETDAQSAMFNAEVRMQELDNELAIIEHINSLRAQGIKDEEIAKGLKADELKYMSISTSDLESQKDAQQDIIDKSKQYINALNRIRKAYDTMRSRLSSIKNSVDKIFEGWDAVNELFEDDSISKGIAAFARDVSDVVFSSIDLVYQYKLAQEELKNAGNEAEIFGAKMNMAMGVIGWIVLAIQLLSKTLKFAFEAHDKYLQEQIDNQILAIEALEIKYEELQQAIEDAYTSADLGALTREANDNLQERIEMTKTMIALEEDKKKTDEEKIKEYASNIRDMENEMAENLEEAFSTVTDGILDNVLDAARGFVDAWYDAFKETRNGIKGLEDNFNEMLLNLLKQQAAMNIVGKFTKKYGEWLSEYINPEEGDDTLTTDEVREYAERVRETFPEVDALLRNFFEGADGLLDSNYGELSDLEKGIQGMTEDQAEVLAAYWNSCRFMLSNIDINLARIAENMLGTDSSNNSTLIELRNQTSILKEIRDSLNSVIGVGGESIHAGSYIKVFS